MRRFTKLTIFGAALLALPSCAYYQKGAYQKVTVVTTPPTALCKIYSEQEGFLKSVATPGSKYIPRDSDPIQIVCEKDGYKTTSVEIKPEGFKDSAENTIGSFMLTGGAGFLPERVSGSYYDFPDRVEITLAPN